MRADGNDQYNAGTILGYRADDWLAVKMYSGLWKLNRNVKTEEIWQNRLRIKISRRKYITQELVGSGSWFTFLGDMEMISCGSRNSSNANITDYTNEQCTPCDEISVKRINKYHKNLEFSRRRSHLMAVKMEMSR